MIKFTLSGNQGGHFTLLESGYRHALQPDPLPLSLRAERTALGIDVPELDTVPLW